MLSDCDVYLSLFRRKKYDIFERTDRDTCSCRETGLNLAQTVSIEGCHLIPNCSIQFARATSLVFSTFALKTKINSLLILINVFL